MFPRSTRFVVAVELALVLAVAGCHHTVVGPVDAGMADMVSCAGGACGNCTDDSDCLDDRYCQCSVSGADGGCTAGTCLDWAKAAQAFDTGCKRPPLFPMDQITVATTCKWNDANNSPVLMAPLVIDVTGDGVPEIVFSTSVPNDQSHIIAIRSTDCSVVWDRVYQHHGVQPLAAADLDGDGHPEIVLLTGSPSVTTVLDHTGALVAIDDFPMQLSSGAVIANLNSNAPLPVVPSIAIEGTVLRYQKGQPKLQRMFANVVTQPDSSGPTTILADLDGDGIDELISSTSIFDSQTGKDKTPTFLRSHFSDPGAFPAVADFNGDGRPELVLVQEQAGAYTVVVFDYAHSSLLFGPYTRTLGPGKVPQGDGGAPTVADLDGDGIPEILIAGGDSLCAFSLPCDSENGKTPAKACVGMALPGALWCKKTQDTSGVTSAAVFDFNGDGLPEVIYRDECWFRIYEGATGRTLFAQAMTSGTGLEYPVIADVDGDGHADIVIAADNMNPPGYCDGKPDPDTLTPWTGPVSGVFVLRDPLHRWPATRSLWTSHPYHVTEINDDLSVPQKELPSWKGANSYRRNTGASGALLPDLTAQQTPQGFNDGDCMTSFQLRAAICNRGAATAPPPVAAAFYLSDPRIGSSMPLCTLATTQPITPGECQPVECDWMNPPVGAHDLWFRVNDNGTTSDLITECKTDNDLALLPMLECRPAPN